MSKLLIIDGHAYAYRAFHAIRELRSPQGQPTNAIYGFIKMLEKMRQALHPSHLIVVWDGGLSAERISALPDYKGQRPSMPDDLSLQIDQIGECLAALGITEYCKSGVEADDYIACLARHAEAAGWDVIIASADKDFMQLVTARVGLLNPNDKTGVVWKRDQVFAKAGVEPQQIVEWLALMGDTVDNIPGVPGVGPKTAATLIGQFGSLESMYARLDEVQSEKLRAELKKAEDIVRRNVSLIQLREVECHFCPENLVARAVKVPELRSLYKNFGFNGLLASLSEQSQQQAELI